MNKWSEEVGVHGIEVLQFTRVLRNPKGVMFSPFKNTDPPHSITLMPRY